MKKYEKIISTLSVASTLLLSPQYSFAKPNNYLADSNKIATEFSGSLFNYSESGGVNVIEGIFNTKFNLDTDEKINAKFTFDSVTGASPTGAVPSSRDQTTTSPSGNNNVIKANTIPDNGFRDERKALAVSWSKAQRDFTNSIGVNYSTEEDYLSKGISLTTNYDFNNKHNTITLGLAYNNDTITPTGGFPTIFATVIPAKNTGSKTKTTKDLLLGISQVIDKNSLIQAFFSYSKSTGYHTDPYKVVSIIDRITGSPLIESTSGLDLTIYEHRPKEREKISFFTQYKKNFTGDVLDVSYRFMTDDWDIDSHTIDSKYKIRLGTNNYIQPHFRYYKQQKASFYHAFLTDDLRPSIGDNLSYVSADYRLGDMQAYTIGVEYGVDSGKYLWNVSLEYYLQSNKEPDKFGALNAHELNPDNEALMVRVNFAF